jgi:hypothetical protein
MNRAVPLISVVILLTLEAMAQSPRSMPSRSRSYGYGEGGYATDSATTAREIPSHSTGTPVWTNPNGFTKDVFTFARVRYSQGYGGYGGYGRRSGSGWATDLPDSDLNLSYRLQQMTSMKVSSDGRIVNLTDPDLMDYPWLYIVEPGGLSFSDEEVVALRKYLLNGGFLMFDDFWGEAAWMNVEREMKRVLPDRTFSELSLDHPLYSCVFQIKSKGQVPNVGLGEDSQHHGQTWEREDAKTVHHRVLYDDKGRMIVFAAHNTDNGDGWEREGEYEYYFKTFSEKIAYPLGINVVFYAMTH